MPAPVASHSTTVTARTEAGTAIRAAAKNAGSIAGIRTRIEPRDRSRGVAVEDIHDLPRGLPKPLQARDEGRKEDHHGDKHDRAGRSPPRAAPPAAPS